MNQEQGQHFLSELPAIKNDLPFSPTLLTRLFRLTDDSGLSPMETIAQAIAEDQGLSTRLLAMANSAFYGLQAQVGSVARAVTVLGLREVRALLLTLGMHGLAKRRPLPEGFVLSPYLEHQLAVAIVAMALARRTEAMAPDDAFTAGVLHDLGKLITALYRPDDWLAQAELAAREHIPWHEAESRHFGLDHGLIGAMVLRSWNLPESLTEPINWHHAPEAAPAPQAPVWLIACADACARTLSPTDDQPAPLTLDHSTAAPLGLTVEDVLSTARTALAERDPSLFAVALAS